MKSRKIPQTDSIEELAKFWDSQDLVDFKDELEEVPGAIFGRQAELPLRLQPSELEAVRRIAKSKGVGEQTLLRSWILEKLQAK